MRSPICTCFTQCHYIHMMHKSKQVACISSSVSTVADVYHCFDIAQQCTLGLYIGLKLVTTDSVRQRHNYDVMKQHTVVDLYNAADSHQTCSYKYTTNMFVLQIRYKYKGGVQ